MTVRGGPLEGLDDHLARSEDVMAQLVELRLEGVLDHGQQQPDEAEAGDLAEARVDDGEERRGAPLHGLLLKHLVDPEHEDDHHDDDGQSEQLDNFELIFSIISVFNIPGSVTINGF